MKNAIVTGAGRRLGRHISIRLAEQGYNLLLLYNQSKEEAFETRELCQSYGVKVIAAQVDIRQPEEIREIFRELIAGYNKFDLLINNAAVFPNRTPVSEITTELWDNTMNINLRSILLMTKEFIKYASNDARIVNIASLGGKEVWKERTVYNVSKAGVLQLTKSLAMELAPKVTVNSVSPIGISFPEDDTGTQLPPISKQVMGRLATPEEVFECIDFFASCSHFITGQNLDV